MSKKRSKASGRTPRDKLRDYSEKKIEWQSLPRGSRERAQKFAAWLAQGQHPGGPGRAPLRPNGPTESAAVIKTQRERYKLGHGLRELIEDDPELLSLAEAAGALDKLPSGVMPGDFANPDPRVYRALTAKKPV